MRVPLAWGAVHRPFHGLTPTATCCRRFAALLETPRLLPARQSINSSPAPAWVAFQPVRRLIGWVPRPMASPNLSPLPLGFPAAAAFAARLRSSPFPWAYAHGYLLPPLRGSTGNTPAAARKTIHQFVAGTSLGRISASVPIDWLGSKTHGLSKSVPLTLGLPCWRRLRGSALGHLFPWAYAHGYLLPPLRGSTGNTPAAARKTIHQIAAGTSLGRISASAPIDWLGSKTHGLSKSVPLTLGLPCWRRLRGSIGRPAYVAFSHVRHTNPGYATPPNPQLGGGTRSE